MQGRTVTGEKRAWMQYLQQCEQQGFTEQYMREYLHSHGYDPVFVDTALADYRSVRRPRSPVLPLIVFGIFLFAFVATLQPGLVGLVVHEVHPAADISLSVQYDTPLGQVNPEFYGVNTHAVWGSNPSWIDTTADGVLDTLSDYTWHREMLLASGVGVLRGDMILESMNSDGSFARAPFNNWYHIDTRKDHVRWAYENNLTVLLIVGSTPTWLADFSSGCTQSWTCAPLDAAAFGQAVVQWLNEVTADGLYADAIELEVWNEPYSSSLLNAELDIAKKYLAYKKIYNATWHAVKAAYPNMRVGGPSGYFGSTARQDMLSSFVQDFPEQRDFVSIHEYRNSDLATSVVNQFAQLESWCVASGSSCKRFYLTEWSVSDANSKLDQDIFGLWVSETYARVLRQYAANASLQLYQWSEWTPYMNSGHFYEFPNRWSMVSEFLLDDGVYAPFAVTQTFSALHGPGRDVVQSSSSDQAVVVVASLAADALHVSVVNTKTVSRTMSLALPGIDSGSLVVYGSSTEIPVVQGVANLGSVAARSVQHYVLLLEPVPEEPENPEVPEEPGEPVPEEPEEIMNTPPENPTPNIHTSTGLNQSDEDVWCDVVPSDLDGDNLTVTGIWYRNDATFSVFASESMLSGASFRAIQSATNTTPGDVWRCAVQVHDHANSSDMVNSSAVAILAVPHSEPPVVVLTSPADGSETPHNDITLTWEASDDEQLAWCAVSVDGVVQETIPLSSTTTSGSLHRTALEEGVHTWTVRCEDTAGNPQTADPFQFTVLPPALIITLDSPDDGWSTRATETTLRWSVSPDELLTCESWLDGAARPEQTGNATFADHIAGLSVGDHRWHVRCHADDAVWVLSDERAFTVRATRTVPGTSGGAPVFVRDASPTRTEATTPEDFSEISDTEQIDEQQESVQPAVQGSTDVEAQPPSESPREESPGTISNVSVHGPGGVRTFLMIILAVFILLSGIWVWRSLPSHDHWLDIVEDAQDAWNSR